jgi:hypothetical protein
MDNRCRVAKASAQFFGQGGFAGTGRATDCDEARLFGRVYLPEPSTKPKSSA